jgi:ATP adenylyltransferase
LESLSGEQTTELFYFVSRISRALRGAYKPDGLNIGMNIGRAGGAGIPSHLHAHALPRWSGDTNFMATIGEVRVLPESLASTWQKVHAQL